MLGVSAGISKLGTLANLSSPASIMKSPASTPSSVHVNVVDVSVSVAV